MNEASTRQDKPAPHVTISVNSNSRANEVYRYVDHQTVTIGRSRDAGIQISDDPAFSRFHSRLEINPPTCSVLDLGSRNGTKINGKRITNERTLSDGDVLTMGQTEFKIGISASPSIAPVDVAPVENQARFPGYEIVGELGRGAMGIVYHGIRTATGSQVAIKVIQPGMQTNSAMLNKFQREASLVLRLQHKRIVKAIDFQISSRELPYLVMEYLETVPFQDMLLEMSPVDRIRRSTGIVCRILEALQFAHEMEIVHRDVKPGNILGYRSGGRLQVKLADFGLAKNYIDAGFTDCSNSNETCGTLTYMAPEQVINCRHAKPTCDIYSTAACLYKLISGKLPFVAENISDMIALVLNETPTPLRTLVPEVPAELEQIIQKGMMRTAEKRYQTANQFREALLPFSRRSE